MKYYEIDFKINVLSGTDNDGETLNSTQMQDARDLVAAIAGEAGFESFEDSPTGLLGYIQQPLFDATVLNSLLDDFPMDDISLTYDMKEAEYKDWNETWENEGFEPIEIDGRLVVHDGRHLPDACEGSTADIADTSPIMIEIDAKMAFGTGTHETTRMIVATLLDLDVQGKTILDCGCGTGILAIAALKMNAEHAIGYDIDEWSVDNARHNAVINRVDDRFVSLLGDASTISNIQEVYHPSFDVVVANINRNILLADMPSFIGALKIGGSLILSGFYHSDADILKEQAIRNGLLLIEERTDNNWSCLVFTKG